MDVWNDGAELTSLKRRIVYPTGTVVAFRLLDEDEDNDLDWACECLTDEVTESAVTAFPSIEPSHGWRDREDRFLLRNAYGDLSLST